jgi:DNA-binding NtrC family response regulator
MKPVENKFLVVEDERALCLAIASTIRKAGGDPHTVGSLAMARAHLEEHRINGMILDIGLPDGHGLDLLKELPENRRPPTIVVTAHGEIENAIEARKYGVREFFDKPINFEAFSKAIQSLLLESRSETELPVTTSTFIGGAPLMRTVFQKIAHACSSDEPVLIVGETGTGKTTAANLIAGHCETGRKVPITSFHPGQSNEELKSILDHIEGGILSIDPISSLDQDGQALLVNRMEATPDFRLIATASPGILDFVRDGDFRSDLFYRLQVLEIRLPKLSERTEDIPVLVNYFLGQLDQTRNIAIDESVYTALGRYDWPGNIRELRNVTTYAYTLGKGSMKLEVRHLPDYCLENDSGSSISAGECELTTAIDRWLGPTEDLSSYREISGNLERILIENLLDRFEGKIAPMASALGANRTTIRKKLSFQADSDE